MADPTPLSLTDMNTISEAVLQLVSKYPNLPFTAKASNVLWQSIAEAESIGLYTLSGAIYLSKYVSGSYVAQFPFSISYKCNPSVNKARISKEKLITDLSKWLEECTATFKDTRITLQSIERTSPIYKKDADDNGYEIYSCAMNLKYFYKKGM